MSDILEQMRPLDDRIASALQWLEARKIARLPRSEYDELTKVYWLLRDIRVGIRRTAERWRDNAAVLRGKGNTIGADSQEFCANELEHLSMKA